MGFLAPCLEILQAEFCDGGGEGGRVASVVGFCIGGDAIDDHGGEVVEENHEGHVDENEGSVEVWLVGAAAVKGRRGVDGEVYEEEFGKVGLWTTYMLDCDVVGTFCYDRD